RGIVGEQRRKLVRLGRQFGCSDFPPRRVGVLVLGGTEESCDHRAILRHRYYLILARLLGTAVVWPRLAQASFIFGYTGTLCLVNAMKSELRLSLSRQQRLRDARSLLLVAPAFLFIVAGFILPMALTLYRGVENSELSRSLPRVHDAVRG